jgi:HNH endonuclease/AP2 domain
MPTDEGIDHAALLEQFRYDPNTGLFAHSDGRPVKNSKAGRYGRLQVYCFGRMRYASRLAWFYVHGVWPDGQVDHINGDHTDNRLSNLRVLTNAQNAQNRSRARRNNSTGLLGVSYDKRDDRYRARIMVDGRMVSLGYYPTAHEAHAAYLKAKAALHPAWSGAA